MSNITPPESAYVPMGTVPRPINGTYLKPEKMADLSFMHKTHDCGPAPSKTQVGGTQDPAVGLRGCERPRLL
jgi:hypothetical protein